MLASEDFFNCVLFNKTLNKRVLFNTLEKHVLVHFSLFRLEILQRPDDYSRPSDSHNYGCPIEGPLKPFGHHKNSEGCEGVPQSGPQEARAVQAADVFFPSQADS